MHRVGVFGFYGVIHNRTYYSVSAQNKRKDKCGVAVRPNRWRLAQLFDLSVHMGKAIYGDSDLRSEFSSTAAS